MGIGGDVPEHLHEFYKSKFSFLIKTTFFTHKKIMSKIMTDNATSNYNTALQTYR